MMRFIMRIFNRVRTFHCISCGHNWLDHRIATKCPKCGASGPVEDQ